MRKYVKLKEILRCYRVIILLLIILFLNITNVEAVDDTVISPENWNDWQEEEYWEWHTRTTTDDKAYNGKHIVIENDVIDFYGYWKNSYKDFLYKEYINPGKKTFRFRIDETKANYHTLDGAGFIFNANKENNALSGYILLFTETNICIYRIDNVDITKFETTANMTVAKYGELIESKPKTNSTIHDLIVEATPTNIKVTEGEKEILNVNLDYSKHVGESFGLISSYLQHACSILSKIEFSQIQVLIEDYEISVLNTNLEDNPIPGGYFELRNEEGELIKEGRTDENAKFIVKGLKEGIYTIQQKISPETYIINDTIYRFKVTNQGKVINIETEEEIDLIVKNKRLEIEINNKLINTETPIPGSKIGLYNKDGKQVATAVTDNNGKIKFIGISAGNYIYKQIEVPSGFELNSNEYTCTINSDGTVIFNEDNNGTIYNDKIKDSTINSKPDNTISDKKIPNAGNKKVIITIIIALTIISIYLIIKLIEYKTVK